MPTRLPRGSFLTTAEAAALLKVSVATLKRWTQSGLLPSERTSGGHRRFRAEDVQALAAPLERPDDPVLLGADQLLHASSALALQAWLLDARRSLGSWWAVVQPVRGVVDELHRRRAAGLLGAVPLEAALDRLRSALLRFAEPQVAGPADRTALLAAVPGDPFLTTPAMLQLCLPESGWHGEWAGHPTVEDLVEEARQRPVDAIVVSASRATDREAVARYAQRLEAAAADLGVPVATLGPGGWPIGAGRVVRLGAVDAAAGWLAGLSGGGAGGGAAAGGHALDWTPSLALGNVVIDAQHQTLFLHARRFLEAVEQGTLADGGREMLAFVTDYARIHFSFEEDLMRASGYPALADHLREHELFGQQIQALARDLEGRPGQEGLQRLARFVTAWLHQHVSGSDQRIGQHLRATGFDQGGGGP